MRRYRCRVCGLVFSAEDLHNMPAHMCPECETIGSLELVVEE